MGMRACFRGILTVFDDIQIEAAHLTGTEIMHLLHYRQKLVIMKISLNFQLQCMGTINGVLIQR